MAEPLRIFIISLLQIIKAGKEDGSRPLLGQEVCIRCEGTLASGDKVDVKEKLQFIIGDGDVVTGRLTCLPSLGMSRYQKKADSPIRYIGADIRK
jgi:hypothetical protein